MNSIAFLPVLDHHEFAVNAVRLKRLADQRDIRGIVLRKQNGKWLLTRRRLARLRFAGV